MTDNDDAKRLMLEIGRLAVKDYPFPQGSTIDARYAVALGLIAGICSEAIHAVQQNRKANFVIEEKPDDQGSGD